MSTVRRGPFPRSSGASSTTTGHAHSPSTLTSRPARRGQNAMQTASASPHKRVPNASEASKSSSWPVRRVLVFCVVLGAIPLLVKRAIGLFSSGTLRIPDRPFATQPYHHLDFSRPIELGASTRVFHVTKEFGPATMGGLGVMLTALAIAQSDSPFLHVSVIMPHYSFLRHDPVYANATRKFTELSIPIRLDKKGHRKRIGCRVSKVQWNYTSAPDFLSPGQGTAVQRSIDLFLVGPGDEQPFRSAFKAKNAGDVYSAYKPLKQEWKDLWFAKATAELIAYLSFNDKASAFPDDDMEDFLDDFHEAGDDEDDDEEDLVARLASASSAQPRTSNGSASPAVDAAHPAVPLGVDIVHLHGATNAMVSFFMSEMDDFDVFGEHPPAVVYTLHDSLDEVEYSNLVTNLEPFLHSRDPSVFTRTLGPYVAGRQIFTSALGIDLADMVTFVSQSIAKAIVEGNFTFSLQSLVMPSIAVRAATRTFVGITNGLDFTDERTNPFTNTALVEHRLAFPRVGPNVTSDRAFWPKPSSAWLNDGLEPHAQPSNLAPVSFSHTKAIAKEYLVDNLPAVFGPRDLDRPWLLFVGRFQYNKGCQFFAAVLELIASATSDADARLVVMGARNNFPHAQLVALQRKYPHHFTLFDDSAQSDSGAPDMQREWGSVVRMASDFAFVPSFSEAFGLVAAEGLLFGMPVVSTGVGGLLEFLKPIQSRDDASGNAHLFQLSTKVATGTEKVIDYGISAQEARMSTAELAPALKRCQAAVREAIVSWRRRRDSMTWNDREMFVRRLVADALELKWSRERGPVEEYVRVYDLALAIRHPDRAPSINFPQDDLEPEFQSADSNVELLKHRALPVKADVTAPDIAHGGHDQASGQRGHEKLAHRNADDSVVDSARHAPAGQLPMFRVWSGEGRAPVAAPRPRRARRKKSGAGPKKMKSRKKKQRKGLQWRPAELIGMVGGKKRRVKKAAVQP